MQAVILAADHATDLSPLTAQLPKHLLPVGDRPYLTYSIDALREAGFSRVAITVNGATPQYDRLLGSRSDLGVQVALATESTPLGTAGCLRNHRSAEGDGPVLVINGNLVPSSDDLLRMCDLHRRSGAAVTVGVVPAGVATSPRPQQDRLSIGPEGALLHMKVEYPSSERPPDVRSAGVYLFERSALALIPDGVYYDLKEQFIPDLLKSGLGVRTHMLLSYQHELNSIEDYLRFHFDLCHGRTGAPARGEEILDGVRVLGEVRLPQDVLLVGPMILGEGVQIGARCRLIGPLVIGKNSRIGDGAFLREAVIGENVRLGSGSWVERAIIEEGVTVKDDARIEESVATSQELWQGRINLVERDLRVGIASVPFSQFVRSGARRGLYRACKRLFDIAFAGAGLLLSLPLMAAVALAIYWDSGRPIIFRQRRCGKNGREFSMLKFRSMRADAAQIRARIGHLNECDGPVFKISNDPRFTKVGKILRRYSLDELPQLWNVLVGEMSVVGPRPLAEKELRTCPSWRDARLRVKPGLTGLWQVCSREKKSFHDWILHDIRYVREQSMALDLSILLRTIAVLTRGY